MSPGFAIVPQSAKERRTPADKPSVDISAIALSGLEQAQTEFCQAARKLASAASSSPDPTGADTFDLSTQTVSLLSAKNAFELNLSALKVANQMQGRLIDVLG
jgi:hypothetical protein